MTSAVKGLPFGGSTKTAGRCVASAPRGRRGIPRAPVRAIGEASASPGRRGTWEAAALLIILTFAVNFPGCGKNDQPTGAAAKKVVILGCDGMDPNLVERLMAEGRLPNFARLRDEGGFRRLTTSIPPQSPVAWSNFMTGAGPGVHGIFDFIHRDLKKHLDPYWSGAMQVPVNEKAPITLGQYQIPRTEFKNESLRRGTPFWEHLDASGIPVGLYRMPADYPPTPSAKGNTKTLCDMGVPDALGNQGTCEHFASNRRRDSKDGEGYKLKLRYDYKTDAYVGKLYGPSNDHRVKEPDLTIDLNVYPDPENDVAKIVFVNQGIVTDETVELVLNVGEWSNWTNVYFLKTPVGPRFGVMVRMLLQQVRPELRLYVSPLNFIPTAPEAVISDPPDFVSNIGEVIGPFYTQGFAESFNALKQGLFTDAEYKDQAWYVLDERFRILNYALDNYRGGLLFFYFSSTDLQAHMFWWNSNDKHPVRTPDDARKYNAVVEDVYVKMDEALGLIRRRVGDDATIIALSDHGFGNFRRGVAVNTWLRDEGYFAAKKGLYVDADWSKTKAYSLGVGGSIYLNLKGREPNGIVTEAERDSLLSEISAKLLRLTDPQTGKPVIHRVYRADEWYHGPEAKNAPDLVLGYDRDYRASWHTCLGDFDSAVIVDNDNAWSADHCIAHDLVPGILLSNRKIMIDEPALVDVAPTVLAEYSVAEPDYMTGVNLFKSSNQPSAATNADRRAR